MVRNVPYSKHTSSNKKGCCKHTKSLILTRSAENGETRKEASGVTCGQVKAPKHIEFRYVAASSFSWNVCK